MLVQSEVTYHIRKPTWWARVLMRPTNAIAITINDTIYTDTHPLPDDILAHELTHVRQWKQLGKLRFITTYLKELLTHGYWNNRLEQEAIEAQLKATYET